MVRICQVCRKLDNLNKNVSFHRFPKDHNLRKTWEEVLGFPKHIVLPKQTYICSDHFLETDFEIQTIKCLKSMAIPVPVNKPTAFGSSQEIRQRSEAPSTSRIATTVEKQNISEKAQYDSDSSGTTTAREDGNVKRLTKTLELNRNIFVSSTTAADSGMENIVLIMVNEGELEKAESVAKERDKKIAKSEPKNLEKMNIKTQLQRKKIKVLQQSVRRLKGRVDRLKSLITVLKQKSDSSGDTVIVANKIVKMIQKNMENVPENNPSLQNIESTNTFQDTCLLCLENIRNVTEHLQSVHSVDWIKTRCLKCSYENIDKDKLLEHCIECTKNEMEVDNLDCLEIKEELKEEICDIECKPQIEIEKDSVFVKIDSTSTDCDRKEYTECKEKELPAKKRNWKWKLKCNRCNEVYKTYEKFEAHFKAAHISESKCILCDQECYHSFSLLYHMMKKHGKLKCCKTCLVSFSNSEELNNHYKSKEHHTKCTACGKQCKNRKALYEHRKLKHINPQLGIHKYKCPKCPKEFANRANIRRHMLVTHNDFRFLCDTCGQSYTTRNVLKLHVQKYHEGLQVETKIRKKNFFCEICGKEFNMHSKYSMAMHMARHKGHNFGCKKCFETFETEAELKKHVETFSHQLFECHKCQAQFVREENFKKHTKDHDSPGWNRKMVSKDKKPVYILSNEKSEFLCSYCPKVFKNKKGLEDHVRVHTNERPYKCHICEKGFKMWAHRKAHLDIHLGIKKWICKYCSKAFMNSGTLRGHEMIHTGDRPHRCPECKKGFISSSALKKHRVVHFRTSRSKYGKKATRLLKDEEKAESGNEGNA